LLRLTGGIGVDRAIDAVGVDAEHARDCSEHDVAQFREEVAALAPKTRPDGANWKPGDAPSQVLQWAVAALAKAGTLAIIGVYPQQARNFPIGIAMGKNLAINMGNCHHRKYIPRLIELTLNGSIDPSKILTQVKPMGDAIEAFKAFDRRDSGWVKVQLLPQRPYSEGEEATVGQQQQLDKAIADSFPASDPLPTTAPAHSS